MEALDDFLLKTEATDWAGCDARAFARAAASKPVVALSKAEKSPIDRSMSAVACCSRGSRRGNEHQENSRWCSPLPLLC